MQLAVSFAADPTMSMYDAEFWRECIEEFRVTLRSRDSSLAQPGMQPASRADQPAGGRRQDSGLADDAEAPPPAREDEPLAAQAAEQPADPAAERNAEDPAEQPSAQPAEIRSEREAGGGEVCGEGDGGVGSEGGAGASRIPGDLGSQSMSISAEPDDSDPDLPGLQENSASEADSDSDSERAESEEDNEFAIAFRAIMQRSQQFSRPDTLADVTEQPAAQ